MISKIIVLTIMIIRLLNVPIAFGFGMFLESVGIPFASSPMLIVASNASSKNLLTYALSILFGTIGGTAGSLVSYGIGRGITAPIFKRRLLGKKDEERELSRARKFLIDHGDKSILLAQLFGTTRTFISIPAGAMRMKVWRFTLYTATGSAIWCAAALGIFTIFHTYYNKLPFAKQFPSWAVMLIGMVLAIGIPILIKELRNSRNNNNKPEEKTLRSDSSREK
ncbi:MAG: DedA family protein [Actinobacteria bacterium]|nr:DedA family protein [Actinomycetota bacterium]